MRIINSSTEFRDPWLLISMRRYLYEYFKQYSQQCKSWSPGTKKTLGEKVFGPKQFDISEQAYNHSIELLLELPRSSSSDDEVLSRLIVLSLNKDLIGNFLDFLFCVLYNKTTRQSRMQAPVCPKLPPAPALPSEIPSRDFLSGMVFSAFDKKRYAKELIKYHKALIEYEKQNAEALTAYSIDLQQAKHDFSKLLHDEFLALSHPALLSAEAGKYIGVSIVKNIGDLDQFSKGRVQNSFGYTMAYLKSMVQVYWYSKLFNYNVKLQTNPDAQLYEVSVELKPYFQSIMTGAQEDIEKSLSWFEGMAAEFQAGHGKKIEQRKKINSFKSGEELSSDRQLELQTLSIGMALSAGLQSNMKGVLDRIEEQRKRQYKFDDYQENPFYSFFLDQERGGEDKGWGPTTSYRKISTKDRVSIIYEVCKFLFQPIDLAANMFSKGEVSAGRVVIKKSDRSSFQTRASSLGAGESTFLTSKDSESKATRRGLKSRLGLIKLSNKSKVAFHMAIMINNNENVTGEVESKERGYSVTLYSPHWGEYNFDFSYSQMKACKALFQKEGVVRGELIIENVIRTILPPMKRVFGKSVASNTSEYTMTDLVFLYGLYFQVNSVDHNIYLPIFNLASFLFKHLEFYKCQLAQGDEDIVHSSFRWCFFEDFENYIANLAEE